MHSTEREKSWDIFQTFKVYEVTLEAPGTLSLSASFLLLKACEECQDGFCYIFSSAKWCMGFHLSIILIYQLVRVETLDVNIIKQSFYKNLFRKEFKSISWYIPRDGLMMREWPYTASIWDMVSCTSPLTKIYPSALEMSLGTSGHLEGLGKSLGRLWCFTQYIPHLISEVYVKQIFVNGKVFVSENAGCKMLSGWYEDLCEAFVRVPWKALHIHHSHGAGVDKAAFLKNWISFLFVLFFQCLTKELWSSL